MITNEPYNINTLLGTEVTVPAHIVQNLQQHIAGDTDPLLYSLPQKKQLSLGEYFYKLELAGRKLYHMSITYKPFADRVYTEKDINTFFKNFYVRKLLPYLMGTRNFHTNRMKSRQPITYSFLDEHKQKAVKIYNEYHFPDRLHHHSILAVDDYSVEKIEKLVGVDTLSNGYFTHKIMTSDIKQCDIYRVVYASKMLRKYPDYMTFPDSFTRHRNKMSQ